MFDIYNEEKARLNALKQLLASTDYKAIKAIEGHPGDDYEEVKVQRQIWRDEINVLEAKITEEEFLI